MSYDSPDLQPINESENLPENQEILTNNEIGQNTSINRDSRNVHIQTDTIIDYAGQGQQANYADSTRLQSWQHLESSLNELLRNLRPNNHNNSRSFEIARFLREFIEMFRNNAQNQTSNSRIIENWFNTQVDTLHAHNIVKEIDLMREITSQKLKYKIIKFVNTYFSKWFCYLWQFIFISLALINISLIVFMRASPNMDLFGIFKLPKVEIPLDMHLYTVIVQNHSHRPSNYCSGSLQWYNNECFNLKLFYNGKLLPLVYTDKGWNVNSYTKLLYASNFGIIDKTQFLMISIDPYCCKLNNKFFQFIFSKFVGIYPLLKEQLLAHFDLKTSKNINSFPNIITKILKLMVFNLTCSMLASYVSSSLIDLFIFFNRINLTNSMELVIRTIIWLSVNISIIMSILSFWAKEIGVKMVINQIFGYFIYSIVVNKVSLILWPTFFHTFNLFISLTVIFKKYPHLDFFLVSSHSILMSVAITMLYHIDMKNIDRITQAGYDESITNEANVSSSS